MEKETKILLAGLPCRDKNNFCKATKEAPSQQQNKVNCAIKSLWSVLKYLFQSSYEVLNNQRFFLLKLVQK